MRFFNASNAVAMSQRNVEARETLILATHENLELFSYFKFTYFIKREKQPLSN